MGVGDTIVEIDTHYKQEITLKRSLLKEDHAYYYNSLKGTYQAQWEVVELVIEHLAQYDKLNFSILEEHGQLYFKNVILNENTVFSLNHNDSLPIEPLDWIGRQIQEDLIILNELGEVVAGQLCFPSGWALNEKLRKQFIEVHAPLPQLTNPMIQAANKLIERLPIGKPVARNNWGFRLDDQLDLSSKHSISYREKLVSTLPKLSMEEFGRRIFLRVEHQTLTRLPKSGYVLFTIHTYNSSLHEECQDMNRTKIMLSFLKTTPVELIEYKVMKPMIDKLINYLETVLIKM